MLTGTELYLMGYALIASK